MPTRFDFKSIKFRVWLYFLGFTAALFLLIWFLQIFFLNNYYEEMKINRTETAAMELMDLHALSDQEGFSAKANSVTQDNDIFVRLEYKGDVIYPAIESRAYSQELLDAREGLENQVVAGGSNIFEQTLTNDLKEKRTYVFAAYTDDTREAILFVIAPLYPVQSTISILQNQLIYIIVISLFLAFLLSYYLTSRITNPISRLNKAAAEMAGGDYSTPFPIIQKGYSEITALSKTLNETSVEVGKSAKLQQDIMANVGHDLRTPLTMIQSYAEMIRDISGDNPEKRNAHLQVIIDETNRLGTLVNDMMSLSQMQAGTLKLNRAPFDIKAATESIVAPYRIMETNESYHYTIRCRESFMVDGDEDRIKQVINNLLTNAIKYCGTDKKIAIIIRRFGDYVHFEVVDHGVGIKPEELDHIWERYYKSSSNHVRTTSGSGLGLSIVSQILDLHQAKYGAESKVGKGTTFWFELPLVVESEPPVSKSKGHKDRGNNSKAVGKRIKHTKKDG